MAEKKTSQSIDQRLTTLENYLKRMEKTLQKMEDENPFKRAREPQEKKTMLITNGHTLVPKQDAFKAPGEWEVRDGEWVKVDIKKKPVEKKTVVKKKTSRKK